MEITVLRTKEGVYYEHEGQMIEVPCQWFAACDNHAATTRSHPALGDVPICQRCDSKIDAL